MAEDRADAASRRKSMRAAKRWLATIAATFLSAYALDAIAALTGAMLVWSGVLNGASQLQLLFFLAGTYIIWGAGLHANLKANWALLEATGTSTNVLSKAAYDVAGRATVSRSLRKFAAASGYVMTELGKEVPYYAGAFGAAVISESISAREAIIFLGGANLGAAAYETALARMSVAYLRIRADTSAYASFESDWSPGDYLREYYGRVEPDERRTIAFFVDGMKRAPQVEPVLVFGAGPTLHHVFLAAGHGRRIDIGDYLPANLDEIRRWNMRCPEAHDWRPFVRYTLECEGLASPSAQDIARREALTRRSIGQLLAVDLRSNDPLGDGNRARYGVVISAYCADSATSDRLEWVTYMKRLSGLVRPGGLLLIAALRRSPGYRVGSKIFPSADIDEDDLRAALGPHFGREHVTIEVCHLQQCSPKGYSGIVLALASKLEGLGSPLAM